MAADICVISGGADGLSVAAADAKIRTTTVLFKWGKMAGNCLNRGCIRSKSRLAAGEATMSIIQSVRPFLIYNT